MSVYEGKVVEGGRGCVCGEREGGTWRERWVVSGAGW